MNRRIRIGSDESCTIKLKQEDCSKFQAEILYEKGYWILKNLEPLKPILVNKNRITDSYKLNKYDVIEICDRSIQWSNYLFEGDTQELTIRDFKTLNGRISRPNYRVLNFVIFGMCLFVYFLPAFLVSIWEWSKSRKTIGADKDTINILQEIGPFYHSVGFSLIALFFLFISIKRMRDTGQSIIKLFIPFYNLYVLYFGNSVDYSSREE